MILSTLFLQKEKEDYPRGLFLQICLFLYVPFLQIPVVDIKTIFPFVLYSPICHKPLKVIMRTYLLQYSTRTNIPAQAIPNCSYHNPKQEDREICGQNTQIQNPLGINGIHGLSSSKDQMQHHRGALLSKAQQTSFIQSCQVPPLPFCSCYTAAHSRTKVKLSTVDFQKKNFLPLMMGRRS